MTFYLQAGLLAATALFLPLVLEGDTRWRKILLRLGRVTLSPDREEGTSGVRVHVGETSHFFPLRATFRRPSKKALLKILLEERGLLLDLLLLSISGWRHLRPCLSARRELSFSPSDPALAGALYGWLSGLPKGLRVLPNFVGEAFCRGEVRLLPLRGMVALTPLLFSLPWGRIFRHLRRLRRSFKEDPIAPG